MPSLKLRFAAAVLLLAPLAAPLAADLPAVCNEPLPLPSELRFEKDRYELLLSRFLAADCHVALGWRHDTQIRFTGPSVARLAAENGQAKWVSDTYGTHDSVLVFYSPGVLRWMCEMEIAEAGDLSHACREECPECRAYADPGEVPAIADGEMILKQMYGATTYELLSNPDPAVHDMQMMALMVKDAAGAQDGWWWGSWSPTLAEKEQLDWPPPANFPYPWMGFGYYCLNCHASAEHESTFSEIGNVLGDPDHQLTFLYEDPPPVVGRGDLPDLIPSHHADVAPLTPKIDRVSQPRKDYTRGFTELFSLPGVETPTWSDAGSFAMPPEPYDHRAPLPGPATLFLTSDQCVGCHAAGSTGVQVEMTAQPAAGGKLLNLAPYGEWRASPMGMAGRDPIFLAQLASERSLHAGLGDVVPDLCLHCHGVMGQRQFCMDQFPDDPERCSDTGLNPAVFGEPPDRELFNRGYLDAVPFGAKTPEEQQASLYGGLARDGVSCAVCHHVRLDEEVQQSFGDTFTGDFRVGPAEAIHGPFEGPQQVPMEHALGARPVHYPAIADSRICGSCHSVVLPVFDGDRPWSPSPEIPAPEFILEQATYPEWVFSDYRDGGARAESCQGCHMRSAVQGLEGDLSFKIASIQEASNFPQTDNRRPRSQIDLEKRSPFSRHTLVGLNVFFVKFAQQFPDLLGIRVQDPMLTSRGIAPLATAYDSMVEQARHRTATVEVTSLERTASELVAEVQVTSDVGHKFPSGVGFRRAFLEFSVLDATGDLLWASGRTSPLGVIVDDLDRPLAGELWWKDGCSPMTAEQQVGYYQPHFDTITRQDQAQIYQELVHDPDGRFTTSFLAIAHSVKDNRLLPHGWEPSVAAAEAAHLGSERLSVEEVVHHVTPVLPAPGGGKTDDPWYVPAAQGGKGGGGDALSYRVRLDELEGSPASVRVRLHYQAIPPFYLQDRFCTAPEDRDTQRLYFLAGHTDLDGTEAAGWKLEVVSSGEVAVP